MSRILITDLTRFNKKSEVCIAGIDMASGELIRPMPYLSTSLCRELNLLPGSVLKGIFKRAKSISPPHIEDHDYSDLEHLGPCSTKEFREALLSSSFDSVESGFDVQLAANQKHVPPGNPSKRSIISLRVEPPAIEVVEDSFNSTKIKLHFTDGSGRRFRYIPITDLGFHNHAVQHHAAKGLQKLNELLQSQREVFLRIGLSRVHTSQQNKAGYWLQANGIYSFPDYPQEIRSYS